MNITLPKKYSSGILKTVSGFLPITSTQHKNHKIHTSVFNSMHLLISILCWYIDPLLNFTLVSETCY